MKHYRELDWPSLPDHVHQQLLEFYKNNSDLPIPQLQDRGNDAVLLDPKTPEAFERKVKFLNQLLPHRQKKDGQNFIWDLYGMTTVVNAKTGHLEPHTDISRRAGYYYVLDGEADTVWYRWRNGPTEPGKSYLQQYRAGELEELERVRFKTHRWYMMDFGSIHAVENPVKDTRFGLGINAGGRFKNWEEFSKPESEPGVYTILRRLTGVVLNMPPAEDETDEIISVWNGIIPQTFPKHEEYY